MAAVSTDKKKKKATGTTKNSKKVKPMADRGAILCWRCKQWGKHFQDECKLTTEQIQALTPQSKEDKPTGQVFDSQFPNA